MTTEYTDQQKRQYDILDIGRENGWRPVPGLTPHIHAHVEGIIRPEVGTVTLRYSPQYGLYAPVAAEQTAARVLMPVHLLVASAWLPRPDFVWFELLNHMHDLVTHFDGNVMNNRVENLAWSDRLGGHDFYGWLMSQRPVPKAREVRRRDDD